MPLPQFTPEEQKDPITLEKERLAKVVESIPLRVGVHAGKGGVGKTFLATQLALLFAGKGKRVGLLDADVDCPNVPQALHLEGSLLVDEQGKLIPKEYQKVQVVSTGLMQDDEPLIIRGPIKHRLLTDFIEKTAWNNLDVLLFDFPPGTSDVPLSAMQVANLTGVVVVTTPQKSSLVDAKRAIQMANKLGVPVYGVVENMSGDVFGSGSGKQLAKEMGVAFICSIPLAKHIREQSESGVFALTKQEEDLFSAIMDYQS